MSRATQPTILAACLAVALAQSVAAQTPPQPAPKHHAAPTHQPGTPVFSSDGVEVGTVERVDRSQPARIAAIYVVSSRFLGFGTTLAMIPEGKFALADGVVRLEMTADEVGRLPHQGP